MPGGLVTGTELDGDQPGNEGLHDIISQGGTVTQVHGIQPVLIAAKLLRQGRPVVRQTALRPRASNLCRQCVGASERCLLAIEGCVVRGFAYLCGAHRRRVEVMQRDMDLRFQLHQCTVDRGLQVISGATGDSREMVRRGLRKAEGDVAIAVTDIAYDYAQARVPQPSQPGLQRRGETVFLHGDGREAQPQAHECVALDKFEHRVFEGCCVAGMSGGPRRIGTGVERRPAVRGQALFQIYKVGQHEARGIFQHVQRGFPQIFPLRDERAIRKTGASVLRRCITQHITGVYRIRKISKTCSD
ncbi:hypothetical protein D3C85_476710 [compost metagenome]